MEVVIKFRATKGAENSAPVASLPDVTIQGAEDIAINQMGMVLVLGPKNGPERQVLGAFPGDVVAGVFAPDGVSMIAKPQLH